MRKVVISVLVVIVVAVAWLWHDIDHYLSSPMPLSKSGVEFEVKPGSNLILVSRMLAAEGVLTHPHYFIWYARWIKHASKISVGDYRIEQGSTPEDLLYQLIAGKVIEHSITLVDGWTFAQVMAVIQANPYLVHRLTGMSPKQVMAQLGHPGQNPEGMFMPDTYNFPRGMTDIAFLQRAYDAMQTFLDKAWQNRDVGVPLHSPYQALILASIVEKETARASERCRIAGVFVRRLIKHMRLQSDPTVIYGMGKQYKGDIHWRDLRSKSPYNTYEHYGLPPTPISLPSRAAIDAVMHPADGDALYFVARGDGSHKFSATLKEQDQAVIKYQLKGHRRRTEPHVTKKSRHKE